MTDELRQAMERLVEEVAHACRQGLGPYPPRTPVLIYAPKRNGEFNLREHEEFRFDSEYLRRRFGRVLSSLPSWVAANRAAQRDSRLAQIDGKWVHTGFLGRRVSASQMPGEFILDYFLAAQRFRFSERLFDERYNAMLRSHDPDQPYQVTLVAPLTGFRMDATRLELGRATLRHLSHAQLVGLVNRHRLELTLHFGHPRGWFEYALEVPETFQRLVTSDAAPQGLLRLHDDIERHAAGVNSEILMLRALTHQTPASPTFVMESIEWPRPHGQPLVDLPWTSRVWGQEPEKSLSHSELRRFKRSRSRFMAGLERGKGAVSAAARRIAFAPDQRYAGDRLADYVSALEALVLTGRDEERYQGEIRYRFSHRVALLVSRPEDRAQTARLARTLYDVRSSVVHGGTIPDDFSSETLFFRASGASQMRRQPVRKHGSVQALEIQARDLAKLALHEALRLGGRTPDWDQLLFPPR
jgi:hypothetical protein